MASIALIFQGAFGFIKNTFFKHNLTIYLLYDVKGGIEVFQEPVFN